MRMRKVTESKKPLSLEELAGSFLAMKKAQKLGQETLYDYEKQIERFLRSSHTLSSRMRSPVHGPACPPGSTRI